MIELESIKKRLQGMNIKKVARESGLHFNTVYKVSTGKMIQPSYHTVITLSNYLEAIDATRKSI